MTSKHGAFQGSHFQAWVVEFVLVSDDLVIIRLNVIYGNIGF